MFKSPFTVTKAYLTTQVQFLTCINAIINIFLTGNKLSYDNFRTVTGYDKKNRAKRAVLCLVKQ